MLLLLYGFLYLYKVGRKKTIITMLCVGCAMISLLVIFVVDSMGQTSCGSDNKTPTCKGKIFGWGLPHDFCNFMSACECQTDSDCVGGCMCVSQMCLPGSEDASGKTNETQYSHTSHWKLVLLIVILCICIGLFVLSIYIFKDVVLSLFCLSVAMTILYGTAIPVFTRKTSITYDSCGKDGVSE